MFLEQKRSILVVDDDPDIVDFLAYVLSSANCEVRSATDGEQALQAANACKPDLVLLDIRIPEQDGWLVCSKLKVRKKAPLVVLITGRTEANTNRFADFVHADTVLRKPFSSDDVLRVIDEMCPA